MKRWLWIWAWLLPFYCSADHLVGGEITMQASGQKPGRYRLELHQYWDEITISAGARDATSRIYIFSKRTHTRLLTLDLPLREVVPITYDNPTCARLRNLKTSEARYWLDYTFDTSRFEEPEGYYIIWERCCRNEAISNLADPLVGTVFYLEFSALSRNGVVQSNSSPVFASPNGKYICAGRPFSTPFSATDADGDELRYSLVDPLKGYTTPQRIRSDGASRSVYPPVVWSNGLSATRAIPGNPALQIDPRTGVLTVTASRTGLFVFSVQCEEFRNGQLIGLIRRDFQLPVVDCPRQALEPSVILISGRPTTDTTICLPETLKMEVSETGPWVYQWQRNGLNIPGAMEQHLSTGEPGIYTVVKSSRATCTVDTISPPVRLAVAPKPQVTLLAPTPTLCQGSTTIVRAEGAQGTYRWFRNGTPLSEDRPQLTVSQGGMYRIQLRDANGCTATDSTNLRLIEPSPVEVSASAMTFCAGSSVSLQVNTQTPDGAGLVSSRQYDWLLNGSPLAGTGAALQASEAGTYAVRAVDSDGCETRDTITVVMHAAPVVAFDPVPALCGTEQPAVPLRAFPTGGIFTGPGVLDGRFYPERAGMGTHFLQYTVTDANGCRAEASRQVVVDTKPELAVQSHYRIGRGQPVTLRAQASPADVAYRWESATYLDAPTLSSPVCTPFQSITYRVTATHANGCATSAEVRVEVLDLLYIPDVFTPNHDGSNDTWVLVNAEFFPEMDVRIFDRWGECLFQSVGYQTPWDGTYRGERVTSGLYSYVIRLGDYTRKGTVMVLR